MHLKQSPKFEEDEDIMRLIDEIVEDVDLADWIATMEAEEELLDEEF